MACYRDNFTLVIPFYPLNWRTNSTHFAVIKHNTNKLLSELKLCDSLKLTRQFGNLNSVGRILNHLRREYVTQMVLNKDRW
jgi:hypothetical protein